MLLCIDWKDASIIAAFIEFGGIILTSTISILIVFYEIKKQKEIDIKRHKAQLLEDCYSIVVTNMDSVIHSYELYNNRRKKNFQEDTEKNWTALQALTLPRIEEATKMLNRVEVVFGNEGHKLSIQELENCFLSSLNTLNQGNNYDKDAYTKAKEDLRKQVKEILKVL